MADCGYFLFRFHGHRQCGGDAREIFARLRRHRWQRDAALDRQGAGNFPQIQSRSAVDLHYRRAGDAVDARRRYSVRLARRYSRHQRGHRGRRHDDAPRHGGKAKLLFERATGNQESRRFEGQESGYRHSVRLARAGDLRGAGPSGPGAAARPHHAFKHRQHAGTHVRFVRRRHRRCVFQSGSRADRGATGVSVTVRSGQSECPVSIVGLGHIAQIYARQSANRREPL